MKKQYKILIFVLAAVILALISGFILRFSVPPKVEEYQNTQTTSYSDGEILNIELEKSEVSLDKSEQSNSETLNEDKQTDSEGEGNKSQTQSVSASDSKSDEINIAITDNSAPDKVGASETEQQLQCTLSVTCNSILDNLERLNPEKAEIVPQNGVIYPEQTVTFYEGESVYNLLLREMKKKKIHLEFSNAAIYSSAYIEGINNIYEFDCGELSGWMYRVNGKFPNYGCSKYILKEGDKVEWIYTCDLGKDIGGSYSAQQE